MTLPWFRIAGGLAALLVVFALVAKGKAWWEDYQAAQADQAALAACLQLQDGRPQPGTCPAPLVTAIDTAREARACAEGLKPDPALLGDWTAPAACAGAVRQLAAERNAKATEARGAKQDLEAARAGAGAAIARANRRAQTQTERKTDADNAIRAAPLGAGGLRRCDAECLRRLAGEG